MEGEAAGRNRSQTSHPAGYRFRAPRGLEPKDVWVFVPEGHKVEHFGKPRAIHVGPRGQDILRRYLLRPAEFYCFDPRDVVNRDAIGEKYDTVSYRRAIHRGCDRAGIPRWSPNRLRHAAGTEVREKFGLEHAQVLLGHSNARVTEIYAERNDALARDVARKIG